MGHRTAWLAVGFVAVSGCSGTAHGHAVGLTTSTAGATTTLPFRPGKPRVIASGVLDGVRWRFIEKDGIGRCRGYSFKPIVPTSLIPPREAAVWPPDTPFTMICGQAAGWDKRDHFPIVTIQAGTGADHSFSVFAAEVASGTTKVVLHYAGGINATVAASSNRILDVERPPQAQPTHASLYFRNTAHDCRVEYSGSEDWLCPKG